MDDRLVSERPEKFVKLQDAVPKIQIDLRYTRHFNFIGQPIDGYGNDMCWLTDRAAEALANVQEMLLGKGYSLLVFDAYRPQSAVDHFIRWSKDDDDQKMKNVFYPNLDKISLFKRGFIATQSAHTRGSTLDLTIVTSTTKNYDLSMPDGEYERAYGLEMGTCFDLFDERSFTRCKNIEKRHQENRLFLLETMEKHGFQNFPMEWWHFTFKEEPFPNTYFDFSL